MRITIDGEAIERGVYFAAVANARYFGGGIHIAPTARLDDGLFDVVILDAISKWQLARKIGRVYRGTHVNEPEITLLRGSHVVAETVIGKDAAMGLLDLDGENPGMLRAEFRVLPRGVAPFDVASAGRLSWRPAPIRPSTSLSIISLRTAPQWIAASRPDRAFAEALKCP